jgi:hypothetical protein
MQTIVNPATGLPVWQCDGTGDTIQTGSATVLGALTLSATPAPATPSEGDLSLYTPDGTTLSTTATALAVPSLRVNGIWTPSDNGLAWASFPPILASASPVPPEGTVAGKLTLQRVLLHQPELLSTVIYEIAAADSGGGFSNCFLGLYDAATGTLQAQTADLSSTFATAFEHDIAWTEPYNAPAGEYFLALLLNGTWTTLAFKSSGGGVSANMNLAAPHLTLSNLGSGLSALPATITLSSQATNLITGGWGSQVYGLK